MIDDAQHLQARPREQPYSSFLVRCWGLNDGRRRIKVQHVQSGEQMTFEGFAVAIAWIQTHRK